MSLVTMFRPEQQASTALIRTTACRGYVAELDPKDGVEPRMVKSIWGKVLHFKSLDRVRLALKRRGVNDATLVQYHACEELGAFGRSTKPEEGTSVLTPEV